MTTWVKDANGNKCSDTYFGSIEAAQAALDSLVACRDSTNCSRCSDCSRCSRCSRCSDCSGCSGLENSAPVAALPPPVPVIDSIHATTYAAASNPRALEMSMWHTCEKRHCRAGWVVALAGEAGRALEAFYNTELAAMLIYDASAPGFKINPARFHDSNDDALADMKRLAESA